MIKIKLLLAATLLCTLSFTGWKWKPAERLKKAEWLLGTWEFRKPNGSIYETWKKSKDSEFSGLSYRLKDQDTVVFETMCLLQVNDTIYLIPTVRNQNQGLPVKFQMREMTETKMVFENPEHDFPQTISYFQISNDSLLAEISGMRNGTNRSILFPMKRVQ